MAILKRLLAFLDYYNYEISLGIVLVGFLAIAILCLVQLIRQPWSK